ncbi:MAG TPA: DUF4286 family protein [Ignavibacteriaceae bacterium]
MIVYNFTVRLDKIIVEDWIQWVQEFYIPKSLSTGHFTKCRVYKVHRDERGGRTYTIQFLSKTDEDLDDFLDNDEPKLLEDQKARFRGRFTAEKTFLSFLDEINERNPVD